MRQHTHNNNARVTYLFVMPSVLQSERERGRERKRERGTVREREAQWTGLHLNAHVFTYGFVTLSILQFQFTEKGFKKTENSEHTVVLLLLLFILHNNNKLRYQQCSKHWTGKQQLNETRISGLAFHFIFHRFSPFSCWLYKCRFVAWQRGLPRKFAGFVLS